MTVADPNEISLVLRFAFFEDRLSDPLIFTVPEARNQLIMGTESIPEIINQAKLRGFRFVDAEIDNAFYR